MATTYTGQDFQTKIKKVAAKIIKEILGDLDGSEANQDFYTKSLPITTSAGATTDDETEVDVYTDDVEYEEDGSDYVIIGATGKVTIQAAENQAGNSGEEITISYYTSKTLGWAKSITAKVERNLKPVFVMGSQLMQEIKEGHILPEGTIDRFYVDRNMLGKTLGVIYGTGDPLPDFTIEFAPNGFTAGQPLISYLNAKFDNWKLDAPLDDIVSESSKFIGKSVTVGTVPA